jgi:hypothetical protein
MQYVMDGLPRGKPFIVPRTMGKVTNFSPTADIPGRKPRKVRHLQEPSDKLAYHIA